MAIPALLLIAASHRAPAANYTLVYYQGYFVIRHRGHVERVPTQPQSPKPVLAKVFRRDQVFAVWDDRGLTIRNGKRSFSTRLSQVCTSPKVRSAAAIARTISLLHSGARKRQADGLSGAVRVGSNVFFLARWDSGGGIPWLEALIKVDLLAKHPVAELVGRFDGISTARAKIDDQLFLIDGRLAVATRRSSDWGLATYSLHGRGFSYDPVGLKLDRWAGRTFVEQTSYGTVAGGELLAHPTRSALLFEDRGAAMFVNTGSPLIAVIRTPRRRVLRNLETGEETAIDAQAAARVVTGGVLIFWPASAPSHAELVSPNGWKVRGTWNQP